MDICSETSHHVNRKKNKLSDEDELLLTLMKLRKNLCMQDLAYRFGISKSSATRIFHAWLDVLYIHLGRLVMWPDTIEMHLPKCFRNKIFRRVRCIIDCTEIFIERASNNKARSQTYSRYKQHNTVKFLIGISPSGAIIFLSPVWGGRASDKIITLTSGIIDKFVPGDVLADRGFFIDTELATQGAQLMVPAYSKGKNQLSRQEVETSRVYSNVRIHVERVINRLKDWGVMKGPLPITLVKKANTSAETTVGKMVQVCAALVNLCPPILE
ncbi:uncharacterized protein LOC124123796 [Haliotis rufescens]|uniref:uncharacterized protein LOC124123796 n=1 Tax=Haliotis rufescens TaxID=6454 RepID=UPI00201ED970|nr:uncharacterized protein LOC124123796 [Haliotis rufescens]